MPYVEVSPGVEYAAAQSLTAAQATQARQNIFAAPFDAMAYSGMQINGGMDVSQEKGTASTPVANNAIYVVDGFGVAMVGTGAIIQASQAPISSLPGFPYCLTLNCSAPNTLASALDQSAAYQYIEGYRWSRLSFGNSSAQSVMIGFWVLPNISGTMAVSIRTSDRSYVVDVPVTAGIWQFKTVTIPGCPDGTWAIGNTYGALIAFGFGAGSGRKAAANTWNTNQNAIATAATTNFFATTGVCYLTGVVVLPGIEAPSAARSPLIMRPYDQELVTCKRYWQQLSAIVVDTSLVAQSVVLPVAMRAAPTVTGGGAGFVVNSGYPDVLLWSQTTRAFQTLKLDARL